MAVLASGVALGQRIDRATHDYADHRGGAAQDRWVDVKTPGNGWTFAVGTTRAPTTDPQAMPSPSFSQFPVSGPASATPRTGPSQVVVLQARDPSGTAWQRYFYGSTPNQAGLSIFARAVSVYLPQWAGATQEDWRIAICGENYDTTLPETPSGGSATQPQTLFPTGFVAVYNGSGALLWSYHFVPPPNPGYVGTTVVTDVAIHVEGAGATATDVVTYCGFTDTGNLLGSSREFPSGTVQTPCGQVSYAGGVGFQPLPSGQTDGFVGRLTGPHGGSASQVTVLFQSLVAGNGNDHLSAIAEITADRFAVVGKASLDGSTTVPPVTSSACVSAVVGTYGYLAVFDASAIRANPTTGVLLLERAEVIGAPLPGGQVFTTEVWDVAVLGESVCIVGTTDNPGLPNAQNVLVNSIPPGVTRAGFVMQCLGPANVDLVESTLYLQPYGTLPTELVGIGGWSEHGDHLYVTGSVEKPASTTPVLPVRRHGFVHSLFRDTTVSTATRDLVPIRLWGLDDLVASTFRPAGIAGGLANSAWPTSGGIAVDERAIVALVGSTSGGTDFPVLGAGSLPKELGQANPDDGVAVRIDLLPPGARRSDGSGDPQSSWTPPTNVDGGTTPACARAIYGQSIGVTPALPRMLIDLEGTPGPGNFLSVLVDRPPATNGQTAFGFLRLGFPSPTPDPALLATYGIEFWMDLGDWLLAPQTVHGGSLRDPLFGANGLPVGSYGFSLQFYTLMTQGFAGCPSAFTFAASPAIYFEY